MGATLFRLRQNPCHPRQNRSFGLACSYPTLYEIKHSMFVSVHFLFVSCIKPAPEKAFKRGMAVEFLQRLLFSSPAHLKKTHHQSK
jgi:hypothetical protein